METITVDRDILDQTLAYIRGLESKLADMEFQQDPYALDTALDRKPRCVEDLKAAMSGKPRSLQEYMANAETVEIDPERLRTITSLVSDQVIASG